MGEINVTNKTDAYNACKSINDLCVDTGERIIKDLYENINNLKQHWIASNAVVHINRLIDIYNDLITTMKSAVDNTKLAGDKIITLQKFEVMTGGSCSVGNELRISSSFESIAPCAPTEQSDYKKGLDTDYDKLVSICNSYKGFKDNFDMAQKKLFGLWLDGCNREDTVSAINTFIKNADTNISNITLAHQELATVKDYAPRA